MSRPSTSQAQIPPQTNGAKRSRTASTAEDINALPMSDKNAWYYPAHGHDTDDEELQPNVTLGNWGNKHKAGARWIKKGKLAAWGPDRQEWDAEQRTRKRIKALMPKEDRRSPSPPVLEHLRSSSPPLIAPYPPPSSQHLSYTSFVMDKSVTPTFRSGLLDELEQSTNALIESEAVMRRALGRLWQVISEDPDRASRNEVNHDVVTKREDEEMSPDKLDESHKPRSPEPDLTPPVYKLFMFTLLSNGTMEPSHFASPSVQMENLDRAIQSLHELQDDGREYMERLKEIRDGLGDVRGQRNGMWDMVRKRAIQELQDIGRGALV